MLTLILIVNAFALGCMLGFTFAPYSPANKRLKDIRAEYREGKTMAEVLEPEDTDIDHLLASFIPDDEEST